MIPNFCSLSIRSSITRAASGRAAPDRDKRRAAGRDHTRAAGRMALRPPGQSPPRRDNSAAAPEAAAAGRRGRPAGAVRSFDAVYGRRRSCARYVGGRPSSHSSSGIFERAAWPGSEPSRSPLRRAAPSPAARSARAVGSAPSRPAPAPLGPLPTPAAARRAERSGKSRCDWSYASTIAGLEKRNPVPLTANYSRRLAMPSLPTQPFQGANF